MDARVLPSPIQRSRKQSVAESMTLKNAMLGKKKITFPNKKAVHDDFKKVLEKEYPNLTFQDGAFELMRANSGGSARPLSLYPTIYR